MKTITVQLIVKWQIPDDADPNEAVNKFWDEEPDVFCSDFETEPAEDGARCDGEVIPGTP